MKINSLYGRYPNLLDDYPAWRDVVVRIQIWEWRRTVLSHFASPSPEGWEEMEEKEEEEDEV